jgi:hypothetical protein
MLKEFILAIIFGSLIGFVASNALVTINRQKLSPPTVTSSPTLSPAPTVVSTPILTIDTPQNESLVSTANITLKGKTFPNSFVLIVTTANSYQTTADNTGLFSVDLSLNLGANILKIKSLSPDNTENNAQILVTYSTAKIQ